MRVGSLCAGFGGVEIGLGVSPAWYAEIEPNLIAPLRDVWHPGAPNLGDITAVDWSAVEPVDLLVGGIPCQPTSAAGKRLGTADPRWLWPATHAAIEALRPQRFLLENVRGLVSYDKGQLFASMLDDLVQLGYGVRWLTLGACAIGLAHHRHRVFVLAERSDDPTIERLDVEECGAKLRSIHFPVAAFLPTPTARDGDGRGEGDAEYWASRIERTNGIPLGAQLALLPTPRASDGVNGGSNQAGRRGDLVLPGAVQPQRWGRFADAIARHVEATGVTPPEPTEPNRNGAPRLRAEFVEWLMAVPVGHVARHLNRKAAIKALGNGVCPPQLAAAWALLTDRQRTDYAPHIRPTARGRNTQVATSEATRDALLRKQNQRRAAVREAAHVALETDHVKAACALHAGIMEMVRVWREDAIAVGAAGKRGWKSREEFLNQCAAEAAGFAGGLTSPEFLRSLESSSETATPQCSICKRALDIPEDPDSVDCGGDCLACMREVEAGAEEAQIGGFGAILQAIKEAAPAPQADLGRQIRAFISGESDTVPDVPNGPKLSTIPLTAEAHQELTDVALASLGIPAFVDPPSAPKRMTWAKFAEASEALPDVDHASFSSITAIADCGVAYALGKIMPETPAWWNVGGTAFHLATEDWERQVVVRPEDIAAISAAMLPKIIEDGWSKAFDMAIQAQKAETPDVPEHEWRIANKGLENYDWWRVNGADMLKRYVGYWAPKRAEGWKIYTMPDGRPALELELSLDVDGQRFDVIVDQVWQRPDGSLFIPDLKSGKSTPAATFQLGGAAWALMFQSAGHPSDAPVISGGFYMARKGSHDLEVSDLLSAHPWDEMRHKVRSFFAMRNAGAYLPRVSNFGGGCSSCGFKAICPARG